MKTRLTFPMIAAALLAGACTPPNGTAGLAIEATSSSALDAAPTTGLTFTDDDGTTWQADLALLRIREIELHLPAGVTCADIAADLVGARCEAEEDHATDDSGGGTDDTGPDDNGTDDTGGTGTDDNPHVDDSQHALRHSGGTDDTAHAEGAAKLEIRGPFLVDLLAGTTTPSLAEVRIPALAYSRLEIRLEDDGRALPNAELGDHAFALRATSSAGETLSLQLRANEEIRIDSPTGIDLAPGSDLLALLDAGSWLSGIPLRACADSTNGTLVIDDESDCADAIEDRLEEAATLGSR